MIFVLCGNRTRFANFLGKHLINPQNSSFIYLQHESQLRGTVNPVVIFIAPVHVDDLNGIMEMIQNRKGIVVKEFFN